MECAHRSFSLWRKSSSSSMKHWRRVLGPWERGAKSCAATTHEVMAARVVALTMEMARLGKATIWSA